MLWRAATGCLLSAASSGWGRCSFWHGCFYAGRMCGHKIETCISAPVKRAGTVQPSLFLPKFSLFFLASCRNQRVFKSSRLRSNESPSGAFKRPNGLAQQDGGALPRQITRTRRCVSKCPGPSAAKCRTRPHPAPVSAQNKL